MSMIRSSAWSLRKLLVLLLVVSFAGLVLDLRYDHNHVLAHHQIAWVPILYSGLMAVASILALMRWEQGGRRILMVLFAAGFLIGLLGFWFHTQGHPFGSLARMLSVWTGQHPDPVEKPPVLAPLAFLGLGLLGILACSERLSPRGTVEPTQN